MANYYANSGEFQVNTYTTDYQRSSSVTALSDGGFAVTWMSGGQDGSGQGVYCQRFNANGDRSDGEFMINTYTAGTQENPSVTAMNDGSFVVTWDSTGRDGSGFCVSGQRYNAAGNPIGSEFLVNTYTTGNQGMPSVTALSDGGFVVTWDSYVQDGSSYGIYGQRYNASGSLEGSEFQVNTYTTNDQSRASVTALNDGCFVVTWRSLGQDGDGYGIYGQRYNANGDLAGGEFQVNTYTTNWQIDPSVTALSDGGFVVTWRSSGQDGSIDGVYGQRYNASGNEVGSEFQVNTYTTNFQNSPSVTALNDGGFVVTWRSYGQDGSSDGIYGQRYNASGNQVGSEFQVNNYTTNFQNSPSVSALNDGGFVVTWRSYGQDGSSDGVYGQRFRADGTPCRDFAGTSADESWAGGAGNDTINGQGGNDSLSGEAGNDIIDGGDGVDTMSGGLGNDTYYVDSTSDVTTETSDLASEIDTVVSTVSRTLDANLENLTLGGAAAINGTGNEFDNILTGNNAANTLDGGSGIDTLAGGLGNDSYVVDNAGDIVSENLDEGTDAIQSSATFTLAANVENLTLTGAATINGTGNELDNVLAGNSAANTLTGGAGNDILNGGAGADTLLGGLGNDTYLVDVATDIVTENAGEGTDTIQAGTTYTLAAEIENLSLTGTAAINGTGNALANTLIGNATINILNGGTGNDSMSGGLGNDTYYVDSTGDVTTETSALASEVDTVVSTVSRTLGANLEKLTLTGTVAISGTGNGLDNVLTGNGAANTLDGREGNDTLLGNQGSDILVGRYGNDILSGGGGNDFLFSRNGNDTLTGGAGSDIFVFDCTLHAATNNDTITDFSPVSDTVRLDRTIFTKIAVGTLLSTQFRASASGAAADRNDFLLYNTSTGALLYDNDGSGAGVATQFATLENIPQNVTYNDFIVVA